MGGHLRFKHAQPNMCHSPKVEDGVENKLFSSYLGEFLLNNFKLPYILSL